MVNNKNSSVWHLALGNLIFFKQRRTSNADNPTTETGDWLNSAGSDIVLQSLNVSGKIHRIRVLNQKTFVLFGDVVQTTVS